PFAQRITRQHHLADDLAGGEVAYQSHSSGVAEAAVKRASHLARHAQGSAIGVGNEDHFEIMAVGRAKQPLAGPVRGYEMFDDIGSADRKTLRQPRAVRLGDIAHRVETGRAATIDLVP